MRLRNLKILIGGIAMSLFTLCAAPAAFAQADPCAGPFPGPTVYITKSGNCSITQAINVTGTVYIYNAANGSILNVTANGSNDSVTFSASATFFL
jgi:hypothetical protein